MNESRTDQHLAEVSFRIREMRQIFGLSAEEMAKKVDVTPQEYALYEAGRVDFPFSFIHKCAQAFGIGITDILEGRSAMLHSYTVTRRGQGQATAREEGIEIQNLAPLFQKKLAEPYWVRYAYSEELQRRPIHLSTHSGQEFDLVLEGQLKVQIGEHVEVLEAGDSIYYNSSTPHGMIAMGGRDCLFCAVVLPGEETAEKTLTDSLVSARNARELVIQKFIKTQEDDAGKLLKADFVDTDSFNFAFDVVDELGRKYPDQLAMLHLDKNKTERRFTYQDMKEASAQCANYFKSLGIKKGDRVMLVLKRHYQFWFAILGLHKLGAIAVPATNQLQQHDYTYRFKAAGVTAIVCTADGDAARQVELAEQESSVTLVKMLAGGKREGWHDFDGEFPLFTRRFRREDDAPCGDDLMLMFFTSGTTGYPKIAAHTFKYPLGHYVTAKYWHCVQPGGLHFTIAETGWGKAVWGKLYGQWMCEGTVFTYDYDRFVASDFLEFFRKYQITTFCAPPTIYRMFIKEDLTKYDFSSVKRSTVAGEALNPEVFVQLEKATGMKPMEGFGQTETTLTIGNLVGDTHKIGSMGKPVPTYDIDLVAADGNPVGVGKDGEIVIRTDKGVPCGLFTGYYGDEEKTQSAWHDGLYHTGDVAWRDEDGFYWYVSRMDDVIKSSGYRIGPFEIESVLMELPYVLECAVTGVPDEVRGQVVRASVVLVKGKEPTEELKKEIQDYVKGHTAPYKYPRIVEFRDELPKTISGKIQRNKL